jgi:UDP-N-acetylglucosamine 2-epimerase (non-hydrolysing)
MAEAFVVPPIDLPHGEFGVVSLHRFELLNDGRLLAETLAVLRESRRTLLWVDHPVTVAALVKHGLSGALGENVRPIPRLDFFGFVAVLRRSAFVVTDSGGSQEECFYLDIPCLVHRARTERREGLGETTLLSELRSDVLRDFLDDPSRFRRRTQLPKESPSAVIVEDLERRRFAAP